MKSSIAITLAASASALGFEEIVSTVNNGNSTWVAGVPDLSIEDYATMCGTFTKDDPRHTPVDVPAYESLPGYKEVAPRADGLDWRTEKPDCTVISKIRDQSACGSCWAFGSTETFEDRRCVSTGEDVEFSTLDTAGCCTGFSCGMSQGCNGGQPTSALQWMEKTGVVTGGDFYDKGTQPGAGCSPYPLQPCAHHVPATSKYPACPSAEYSVSCKKSCSESSYTKSYAEDKTKGSKVSSPSSAKSMISALEKGPLSVAFTVYSDFPTYKSGVYQHKSGSALGGHAVEVIGYGTEEGTDYWLVKNSWNEQWGDGGCFKILRGSNECGIESEAAAIDF